jgi:hypothetical protein
MIKQHPTGEGFLIDHPLSFGDKYFNRRLAQVAFELMETDIDIMPAQDLAAAAAIAYAARRQALPFFPFDCDAGE